MARRLVEVEVDADHEVERLERGGEAVAVRRRQHRVAGDREQRADLAVARRLDLLGQAGGGQLAERSRGSPRTRVAQRPTVDAAAAARARRRVRANRRRAREHRAARAVEVAGERR